MLLRILILSLIMGFALQANDLREDKKEKAKDERFLPGAVFHGGELSR